MNIVNFDEREINYIHKYNYIIINNNCIVIELNSKYYINLLKLEDDYYLLIIHKKINITNENYLLNCSSLQYVCKCDQFHEVKKLIKELHKY